MFNTCLPAAQARRHRPRALSAVLLAIGLSAASVGLETRAAADPLRSRLESTYAKWQSAMMSKDYRAWARSTASHRQTLTRNIIVSQRLPFPRSLFELPMRPPEIANLKFIDTRNSSDEALAIYYGKVDYGVPLESPASEVPENLFLLYYYKEDGQWKFDSSRYLNLNTAPGIRGEIARGNRSFLDDPQFELPPPQPPAPEICPLPDYTAHLRVVAIGYECAIRINQHHLSVVSQNVTIDLVIGGLMKGKNLLALETTQLEAPEDPDNPGKALARRFELSIWVRPDDPRKPPVRVYEFAPETVPAVHQAPIWANAVTIPEG
ncbi:MAG: hypothetical protein ACC661_06405 [Verrucomicrobiales bacterium]